MAGKYFGQSVATANGLVVVGAFNANTTASQAGAVYVFKRVFSAWIEEAILTAPDGTYHDWFGWSVATDGDAIVAGTRSVDDAGAAYDDGVWRVFVYVGDEDTVGKLLDYADGAGMKARMTRGTGDYFQLREGSG